ncbi:MAG: Gfo/Idh/MocA family oxidoreductase, partial [Candidatus Binatus sp.]|uniref:Gfo/Idh/MocA family protein n=1 Tax=Candidatus Binatus sp. TaxID=2811406 RepID=UPI003D1365DC
MKPLERVQVGLIGCGRIASLQVLGYRDHSRAELTAICDNDEALLGQRQQEWQPKKTYRDYRQLLADSDVNAVEILIPHHLHREVAIAALQAGKHVSLQKPPALTIRELD